MKVQAVDKALFQSGLVCFLGREGGREEGREKWVSGTVL